MLGLARKAGVSVEELRQRQATKQKWCHRCKQWRPHRAFTRDRTRYDGLYARCADCRSTRVAAGPTLRKRREMKQNGLKWCRECREWAPAIACSNGLCRRHAAEGERIRYQYDPAYRMYRLNQTSMRKRNVPAVPLELRHNLTEWFEGLCAYCDSVAVTFDHIDPVSRGGQTIRGNIVPVCTSCNSRKKDLPVEVFMSKYNITKSSVIEEIIMLDA